MVAEARTTINNGRFTEPVAADVAPPRAMTHDELINAVLPEPRPLVEGLIEEETGNILAGPPSVGKTWLVLSLARAIASGGKWLGHFPTHQAAVLMVDEESTVRGLQARAQMLEWGDPLGPDLPLHFAVGHGIRVDANPGAAHLVNMVREHQPKLVIMDSLTRVHGANENDAGQMADVFANVKQLMRTCKTAVLFTDHIRKKSLLNDPEEMLRGSTEKRAWPECILFVSPSEDKKVTITHVKARYTEQLADFEVAVEVDSGAGAASVRYLGEATSSAVTKANELIQAIHAVKGQLGPDGADCSAVAAWLNCSSDTVRRHTQRLASAGLVRARQVKTSGRPKDVFDVVGGQE